MRQPVKHIVNLTNLVARRQGWAVDHDDWQVQGAGGVQFGDGPGATCVFAHNDIDTVDLKQRCIRSHIKRAARDDDIMVGQRGRHVRRIYQAQNIVVLGLRTKFVNMHTAKRQHDAPALPRQRSNCAGDIRDMLPSVTWLRTPCRSRQRQQRHAQLRAGVVGVPAHLCRKRVCGINNMADIMIAQVGFQTSHAAKTTNTVGNGLRARGFDAASIGKDGGNATISDGARERAGLGCAAKDKKGAAHV